MKKRLGALLLTAVLCAALLPRTGAAFTDITDPGTALAAATLQGMDIVTGTSATTFSPNSSLTRAEACTLIINTMGLSNQVNTYKQKTLFTDVLPSAWYTGIVNLAYAKGIVNGYGNGTFGPDDRVTYGQFATMLLRLLGYSTEEIGSVWPLDYTAFCDDLGLSDGLSLQPDQVLTRGQAAVLLYRALDCAANGTSKPYYAGISGVTSTKEVILLDNNASYGGKTGLLKVCAADGSSAVSYCEQANRQSDTLVGAAVTLLLNSSGQAVGAYPLYDDALDRRAVSCEEVVLLDTDASYEGVSGLLKAAPLDGSSGVVYYAQATEQNSSLTDQVVTLLLDCSGQVVGMIPGSQTYRDVTISARKDALLLSVDTALGGESGLLSAYLLDGSGVSYYSQTVPQQGALTGTVVTLLLDSSGDVVGTVPKSTGYRDVVISSAKSSGLTDADGITHRISASAATIIGEDSYTWSTSGCLQLNNYPGKVARLFYSNGSVIYVYLTSGTTGSDTQAAYAKTTSAAGELARSLGVTGSYTITKNGAPAVSGDLARYDTAYYDGNSNTLCVSDYKLTGYIQSVSPAMDAAQTITVAGCTLSVLEAAWDTLDDFSLGDRVTLLLTDDCKVAAALSPSICSAELVGVLSQNGGSVTLQPSGLVVTAGEVDAAEKLRGKLVSVSLSDDTIYCYSYSSSAAGKLTVSARTLGSYSLAPACRIYDQAGSSLSSSYLYSLDGELGTASHDFEALFWTDTLAATSVAAAHLNTAGQVDVLVLRDVTGNSYQYGKLTRYTGTDGVVTSTTPYAVYNSAATITNGSGTSSKYLSSYQASTYSSFFGIALQSTGTHQEVVSLVTLARSTGLSADSFVLQGEDWSVVIGASELPVSEDVQVYVEATEQWLSGSAALQTALSAGKSLDVHYDRTADTGAQVRVIVVKS